ncbi:hypothetical protein [Streptomyces sp. 4R-3d]|uniref:hypothetical protein n=1 Tax=Streptomyces sp. 4R-3d TaxID=2559605 RepID=UPI001071C8B3|nr:hypothetical protein [Streptomyces sp. 4R-3d]TFI30093.1 hypothetical protein E4P36_04915 [Streptomyces sp. 4R-3d]
MPDLMVRIGEETVSLRTCHWVLLGPDGCAYASEYGDGALDAERAHRNFTPRQRDRDRQTRQGYTVQLLTKDQWRKRAAPCFYGKCPHRKQAAA